MGRGIVVLTLFFGGAGGGGLAFGVNVSFCASSSWQVINKKVRIRRFFIILVFTLGKSIKIVIIISKKNRIKTRGVLKWSGSVFN